MKRSRLAGLAALVIAGGALVGCQHTQQRGPYYSGWGGCCSQNECRPGTVPGTPEGLPMMAPAQSGDSLPQPSHGAVPR